MLAGFNMSSAVSRSSPLHLPCPADAVVRGHRSGLLTAADYNNLAQCESLDDIKLNLVRAVWRCAVRSCCCVRMPQAHRAVAFLCPLSRAAALMCFTAGVPQSAQIACSPFGISCVRAKTPSGADAAIG